MTHRPPGLHEERITHRLEGAFEDGRFAGFEDQIAELDPAVAPQVLARSVHDLVDRPSRNSTAADQAERAAMHGMVQR